MLRRDGSHSLGSVTHAYEGVFGVLYQVRMSNGVYKQAVPEEELCRCSSHSSQTGGGMEEEATDGQARTLVMWQMAMMDDQD